MPSGTARVLQGWDNFYYLIGSAAAGLIGLLFVVMTLTAGRDRSRIVRAALVIYMTPDDRPPSEWCWRSARSPWPPGLTLIPRGVAFGLFALSGLSASDAWLSRACARLRKEPQPPHWSDHLVLRRGAQS